MQISLNTDYYLKGNGKTFILGNPLTHSFLVQCFQGVEKRALGTNGLKRRNVSFITYPLGKCKVKNVKETSCFHQGECILARILVDSQHQCPLEIK